VHITKSSVSVTPRTIQPIDSFLCSIAVLFAADWSFLLRVLSKEVRGYPSQDDCKRFGILVNIQRPGDMQLIDAGIMHMCMSLTFTMGEAGNWTPKGPHAEGWARSLSCTLADVLAVPPGINSEEVFSKCDWLQGGFWLLRSIRRCGNMGCSKRSFL
jgi:hypothetical protein